MSDHKTSGQKNKPEPHSQTLPKKSILVVEDDWNSQKYYEHILSPEYEVLTTATSTGAFSLVQEHSFDLIIMDIMIIGEEDGLSLTRRIRMLDKLQSIPVIAVSAYAFPEDKLKALNAGCNDFLSKPVRKDDLLRTIDNYLNRQ